MSHKRPKSAMQEDCSVCKSPAYHKVAEEYIGDVVPTPFGIMTHPMTNYICCACYNNIMHTNCKPEEA